MSKYILPICVYDNLEMTRGPQGPPGTFACPGNCFGQYIYWNGEQWVIGSSNITLGCGAGEFNQGLNAVALGENAGHTNQGDYAIAIGYQAGLTGQADNSIILNATGEPLNAGTTGFFVAPIRGFTGFNQTTLCGAGASGYKFLMYNPEDTKEVIYYDASGETLVPCADIYSQYLFWDPSFNAWKVGGSTVHLGNNAGLTNQTGCSIALGVDAGRINQNNAIAIGCTAGYSNQNVNGVAIGNEAQEFNGGTAAVAIGNNAGNLNQGRFSVAVGNQSGSNNQGSNAVAVGHESQRTNGGTGAVAIGYQAGLTGQGQFAVAVGYQAGLTEQGDRTIVLNATGLPLGATGTDKFYVKPVRQQSTLPEYRILYNPFDGEITYDNLAYLFGFNSSDDQTIPVNSQRVTVFTVGTVFIEERGFTTQTSAGPGAGAANGTQFRYDGITNKTFRVTFKCDLIATAGLVTIDAQAQLFAGGWNGVGVGAVTTLVGRTLVVSADGRVPLTYTGLITLTPGTIIDARVTTLGGLQARIDNTSLTLTQV